MRNACSQRGACTLLNRGRDYPHMHVPRVMWETAGWFWHFAGKIEEWEAVPETLHRYAYYTRSSAVKSICQFLVFADLHSGALAFQHLGAMTTAAVNGI